MGWIVAVAVLQKKANVLRHVPRGDEPVNRSFGHRFQADAFQLLGDRVVDLAWRSGLRALDLLHHLGSRIAPKWSAPGQEFVKDNPEAEDIRASIDPVTLPTSLLRAHVGGGSQNPGAGAKIVVREREPEVGYKRLARGLDQDVAWLDVSMYQSVRVGVMKSLGHGGNQFGGLTKCRSNPFDPSPQIAPLDEL